MRRTVLLLVELVPLVIGFHASRVVHPTALMPTNPLSGSRANFGGMMLMAPDHNAVPELEVDPKVSEKEQALVEVEKLRALAEQQRLEAEQMATVLTLEKIENLEKKAQSIKKRAGDIPSTPNRATKDQEEEIRSQIAMLKRQLEPSPKEEPKKERPKGVSTYMTSGGTPSFGVSKDISTKPSVTKTRSSIPASELKNRINAFKQFPKEVQELFARSVGLTISTEPREILIKVHELEEKRRIALEENPELDVPMDLLDIANAQAGFSALPLPIQSVIAESAEMGGCNNQTAIIEKLIETKTVQRAEDGGVEFLMSEEEDELIEGQSLSRDFTAEEKKNATEMFETLPGPMKAVLKSSADVRADASVEEVVEELIKKKKMLPSTNGGVEFVLYNDDDEETRTEGAGYVKSLLPAVTRKEGQAPTLDDVNIFFAEALGRKTFNPISKPEKIPGGFVIRGENRLKNGDALVTALDESLQSSSVAGKMQVFFIKDPTLVTEEQYETDTMEQPLLLVTGPDLSPDTNRFVKPIITALGGFSIACFGLAVSLSTESATPESLYWAEEMVSPLLFAVLGTQIAHEAAHQVVAVKDKFKAGAPTIIPSLQLGFYGCITPLKSSPKNLNSLFDFAIAGPLVGILISVVLMYIGLEKQVFMDQLSQSQLPSLPIELVRSSSLAGGMVEWLLGDGALLSPDPTALIRLHPLAIAGFIGILSNALNLLPLGNTDGGRVALSLFGRSLANVVRTITVVGMIGAGLLGDDKANLLLFFAVYSQIWQRETEIPCRNEVDGIDDFRVIVGFVSLFLAGLAIVPLI